MHHPGPPRFCAVGETVELAPRAPDPDVDYEWTLVERPVESGLSAPETPVGEIEPDVPGIYRFELGSPAGTHEQRVRVFPDIRRKTSFDLDRTELPEHDPEEVSIMGPFNEHRFAREWPTLEDGIYRYEIEVQPGTHRYGYVPGEDFENAVWTNVEIPGPGRPRVRLEGKIDESGETVTVTAEAAPGTGSEYAAADLEVEFYADDRDPLSDDDLAVDGRELRVDLTDLEEAARVHAVAVGERHSVADRVVVHPDGRVDRPNDPPEWAEDAVVYEIFVRSFTDPASFRALERRVPYLESLGIDCLWLTPVLESPTEHGYHTTDYFDTASDLGTREEFESFVDRCHEAGIRVVFDLVINHTAREHAAFDMSAARVPEYDDWYVWEPLERVGIDAADLEGGRDADSPPSRRTEDGRTEVADYYFNWHGIPNVNYDSLAVRSFFRSVVEEWVDVVDGFRCDVAWGVPHGYWKELAALARDRDAEFLLLDETIPREPEYAEGEFNVHYDTTLYYALREIGNGQRAADELLEAATAPEREGFPDWSLHMRYVENHDETRYLTDCGEAAQRAAVAAVLTLPGMPMIYYGQERGATEYRQAMPWEGDSRTTTFHRQLVAARRNSEALSRGALVDLRYESDSERVVAFAREADTERVVVALNFGSDPVEVSLNSPIEPVDLVTDTEIAVEDGTTSPTLEVEDVVVARLE
ncbi:alpha-amylase family glycosyl hydrolase [Natronococcus sp.]|uniref:alpha-amylase family glycosyl hydrolase n=1 Tax=Natronococcus sp. TaxID=35747 RepID=UPI0025E2C7EA|nr:alpha-amylase family glycosyl hydrolase [Natronococcus sp.]